MEKAPYTPNPVNIKRFLQKMQDWGIPPKLDVAYLKTLGFKSSNDRYIPGILKLLGFLDSNGVPQSIWNDYKDKKKAPAVLASAIRNAYSDLFNRFPDANKADVSTIQNYFSSKFGASGIVARLAEQTFKNLCEMADFEAVPVVEGATPPAIPAIEKVAKTATGSKEVTININIQLQLPATEDATIYDNLFSALKKHLFS